MKILNKKNAMSLLTLLMVFATSMIAFAEGEDGAAVSNYFATFWAMDGNILSFSMASFMCKEIIL